MLKRGLFTRVLGDMILLAPPLVSTEEHIDQIVAIICESVQAVIEEVGG
jgi:adenosylmethionine-8-amino-7-oxononanoate aminotransferase